MADGGRTRVEEQRRSIDDHDEGSPVPMGMAGGGIFDINGVCKGMIEGVVQKPDSVIVGEEMEDER